MKHTVIIQDSSTDSMQWLSFSEPVEVLCASQRHQVSACLQRIEQAVSEGLYAVGFLSYEAAPALDSALQTHELKTLPYLWFGLYQQYTQLDDLPVTETTGYELQEWKRSVSWHDYSSTIDRIKHHIREGDGYQVNYTHKLHAKFKGDTWALFVDLCHSQKARYSAYIDLGDYQVLSVSPELFVRLDKHHLLSKPMKGTVGRGLNTKQDQLNADWLRNSSKNRAENLMIVDMVRNDMGRVADTGSVRVSSLFDVESYPTVNQMTSSVEATTSKSLSEILGAMFPCASVTGAPKAKTMELIKEIEPQARGIYTGSIGFIKPNGCAQFNVAIRTVLIDSESGMAEYGVGGGIVWDSDAESEYAECKTKADVLIRPIPDFQLLESLLWKPEGGYWLLEAHIARLAEAAGYFKFPFSKNRITEMLEQAANGLTVESKIRLLLGKKGEIKIESSPLGSLAGLKVGLAVEASDTQSPFCYHKTTYRKLYQQALDALLDCDDVMLWNQQGLVTESTRANLVVQTENAWLTPALNAGLLPGVYRDNLLKQGMIREAEISLALLRQAKAVYLVNSVRGWLRLQSVGTNSWRIQEVPATLALQPSPDYI